MRRVISPVLVDLGIPSFTQFLLGGGLAFSLANLHLYPLTCTQNFALQVETAALLGVVEVEKLLESLHDMFEVGFAAGRGLDVEDPAGLVESQTGRTECAVALLLCSIFAGCLGLLVGFGEGAAENPGSGDDDLGDDAVSLLGEKYVRILSSATTDSDQNRRFGLTYHVDGVEVQGR